MVNPFPLARRKGRAHAHRNPMEPYRNERSGLYRPRHVQRVPHSIPDEKFNELFAQLSSHRDRALVAMWVSSGARAAELLSARQRDADPGQQLTTVARKGTRAIQQVPASPDAFVWLRLYQAQIHGLVAAKADDPLWWTLRRPFRPLAYHAAYRMFGRVNAVLGVASRDIGDTPGRLVPGMREVHAGRAVRAARVVVDLFDDLGQQVVVLLTGRGGPAEPVVVTRSGDAQHPAGHRDFNVVVGEFTD